QFTRIGLVFGYRDAANFWFHGVSYDPANSQGKREIVRFTNGSPTVVVSSYRSNIVPGSTHNMHFGSLQNYAQIAGLGYTFPEGFPGGRVGLYSNTAGAEFPYAWLYPNDHGRPLAGRWDRYEPDAVPNYGIKVTNTDLRRHRPTLLVGPRVGAWGEPFRATFSMTRSGASRNHDRLRFLFGVEDEGIYNEIQIAHKSGSAIAPSGSRRGGPAVTGTQTAANMPTPANPGDRLWVRVESDGTTVTVKAAIDNNGAPSEAIWSGTGVSYESPNFILTGGKVGFRAAYGTAYVRTFKLETDHDANGSWTTEYDGNLNQPTGYATQVYEHDAAGNLTYDGTFAYGYDAWNRLATVTNAYRDPSGGSGGAIKLGSVVQEVAYDGLGRRVTKRVLNSADFDATEHYYYSGQQTIETRNGSDLVLKQQIWGLDYIDEFIATSINHNPFATPGTGFGQDPDPQQCDAEYFALHNAQYNVIGLVGVAPQMLDDMIGNGWWQYMAASVRGFTNAALSGTLQLDSSGPMPVRLVERYEYTPYGERQVYVTSDDPFGAYGSDPLCLTPVSSSRRLDAGQALNTIGHQGLSHDEETGLVYNRARYLHPQLGRFVQRDPLGYVDGMNTYAYYAGISRGVDPSGLSSEAIETLVEIAQKKQEVTSKIRSHISKKINSSFQNRGKYLYYSAASLGLMRTQLIHAAVHDTNAFVINDSKIKSKGAAALFDKLGSTMIVPSSYGAVDTGTWVHELTHARFGGKKGFFVTNFGDLFGRDNEGAAYAAQYMYDRIDILSSVDGSLSASPIDLRSVQSSWRSSWTFIDQIMQLTGSYAFGQFTLNSNDINRATDLVGIDISCQAIADAYNKSQFAVDNKIRFTCDVGPVLPTEPIPVDSDGYCLMHLREEINHVFK
ncbi:MAG: RHS repeat-associated core domain-containing protein, partial [Planctomycetota bacterium]